MLYSSNACVFCFIFLYFFVIKSPTKQWQLFETVNLCGLASQQKNYYKLLTWLRPILLPCQKKFISLIFFHIIIWNVFFLFWYINKQDWKLQWKFSCRMDTKREIQNLFSVSEKVRNWTWFQILNSMKFEEPRFYQMKGIDLPLCLQLIDPHLCI